MINDGDIASTIQRAKRYANENTLKAADALEAIAKWRNDLMTPRHIDEWHEDIGPVLWWTNPITEAPYIGSPLDCERSFAVEIAEGVTLTVKDVPGTGWPGYHEWWTPLLPNDDIGIINERIAENAKTRQLPLEPSQ